MKFRDLMLHCDFSVKRISETFGFSRQIIHRWKAADRVPMSAQLKIEKDTNGLLKPCTYISKKDACPLKKESVYIELKSKDEAIEALKERVRLLEGVIRVLKEVSSSSDNKLMGDI